MRGYDPIKRAEKLRERMIIPEKKQVLFASFEGTSQQKDITVHTRIADDYFRAKVYTKPEDRELDPFRGEPAGVAAEKLTDSGKKKGIKVSAAECNATFLGQIAGCNLNCWQCYVDRQNKSGNPKYGRYFTAEDYLVNFLVWSKRTQNSANPDERLNILRISGGEVFIVPEIIAWTVEAVEKYNLRDEIYLWVDCNLATGNFYWEYLSDEQREKIRKHRNLGVCVCYKGCDRENFFEITGANPDFFDGQFELHRRLIEEGLDVYSYYYPLISSTQNLRERIVSFMDLLMEKVDPLAPLRLATPITKVYGPTQKRLTPEREKALENQWKAMQIWKEELAKRYSPEMISKRPHQLPASQGIGRTCYRTPKPEKGMLC